MNTQSPQPTQQHLASLPYAINCPAMTIQDAVDFTRSMVEITIAVQRFTHGLRGL